MKSRKEMHRKNKSKKTKIVFTSLLLCAGIGTGNVALANQDISSLLTSWFNTKTEESITQIDNAISTEKASSMEKLEAALSTEMQQTEKEIVQFTEAEKARRVEELKRYTNQLIATIDVSSEGERAKIAEKLNAITQQAIKQMDNVSHTNNNKPVETTETVESTGEQNKNKEN
jgi:hypothetical protein